MQTIETTCPQGRIRGRDLGGVYGFLGIPYARDGGRFRYAQPAASWEGTLDATGIAGIFPQKTHRITVAGPEGPVEMEQTEDAYVVNVWTPGMDDAARPVIVWLHGGGWSAGSGCYPSSDGEVFAREQDAVFVTANYRLGALGNLSLPGIADDNLSVHDAISVLGWVQENIAAFGGDPSNVCLAGQSAGAWYAIALAGLQAAHGKFAKLMLMSVPTPSLISTRPAAQLAQELLARLGIQDDPEALYGMPVDRILEATQEMDAESGGTGVVFAPYDDGTLETAKVFERAAELSGDVPMLDGVTRDEAGMFAAPVKDMVEAAGMGQVSTILGKAIGSDPSAIMATYDAGFPDDSAYERLVRVVTDAMFIEPGNGLAAAFENSYGYVVELESANPAMRACHCMDVPLLFGNMDVQSQDPMLAGNDMDEVGKVSARFQASVNAFMRTGCPETDATPDWPRFEHGEDRVAF